MFYFALWLVSYLYCKFILIHYYNKDRNKPKELLKWVYSHINTKDIYSGLFHTSLIYILLEITGVIYLIIKLLIYIF